MAQELNVVSSDSENFVSDYADESEYKFDEFEGFKSRIKKLSKTSKFLRWNQKTLFILQFSMLFIMPC